ncbi:hypothetical protein J2W30_003633 [Variovorax boronicumulans]|uniref:hypothetical protein n=1 Tax=Variovorax boronicumulans TaxID=436515 RepID=UPI002788DFB2|nr:hypothetical protein [Variovorax boronicumulans]MDQ0035865.1 hypothetical protein [Variovorax boronicumulans]
MREADAPKAGARGRYRKVEVRTWGDEKFRALSPMPPCGQGLWLYLITGPHTGPIPGLFRAGRAALAEDLDWDVEAFDKAFGEAFAQGMVKADFKARVIWLPSAIKHNKPESPNVVRSWAAEFDLIPECDLKREAFGALKASIHALGEAFGKAFDEAFGKPSLKPSPKTMPNQEQEQEQEQEQDKTTSSSPEPTIPRCQAEEVVALYHEVLPEMPKVRLMTEKRKKAIAGFWRFVLTSKKTDNTRRAQTADQALTWIRDYFSRARDNDFLMGRTQRGAEHSNWQCDLDFLLTDKGKTHVIEKTREAA